MKYSSLFQALIVLASINGATATQISVTAHSLDRGSIISESDLESVDDSVLGHRVGLALYAALIGKELRRTIAAGQPIYNTDIKMPDLVKRDELVTMLVSHGGMTIAATGKALENGAKGNHIRVQNMTSKLIIEGEIAAPGTVVITPLSAPQIPAGY